MRYLEWILLLVISGLGTYRGNLIQRFSQLNGYDQIPAACRKGDFDL